MHASLLGLTNRGRSFLAAAVAAAVCAYLLGESDLLRLALLLATLPILATIYVGRSRVRLSCNRVIEPGRVPVGSSATNTLRLTNLSRLPTGTMLLEDRLPYALGTRPRLVLDRLSARATSQLRSVVNAQVRGRYEVGPLVIRIGDPFGLCELAGSFTGTSQLTVVPRTVSLPAIPLAAEHTRHGESRARAAAVHGDDDVATREYRYGDDLRRVHWRSTAHVGELMVRREEQPWASHATVLLDTRPTGHRGTGPASSFEWSVTAAASIAVHLLRGAYRVRLVTGAGEDIRPTDASAEGLLLDSLADVAMTPASQIHRLVSLTRRGERGGGLVLAVLGALSEGEAQALAELNRHGTTCVALLVDPDTWLHLSDSERELSTQRHHTSKLALMRAGWRVVDIGHGADLASLWPKIARGVEVISNGSAEASGSGALTGDRLAARSANGASAAESIAS